MTTEKVSELCNHIVTCVTEKAMMQGTFPIEIRCDLGIETLNYRSVAINRFLVAHINMPKVKCTMYGTNDILFDINAETHWIPLVYPTKCNAQFIKIVLEKIII